MDVLEQLSLALGLAGLAGVNLYLTTALVGIAVHFDLLRLAERHEALAAVGHPLVIGVALALFLVEFFADKIPWVDSVWDAVHTLVRPAGAIVLGFTALGEVDPALQVVGALMAGGTALATHSTKAGTRLLVNASPEPFSNMALSVTEDLGVIGGFVFLALLPVIAFVVFVVLFLGTAFLLRRLYQRVQERREKVVTA